MIDIIMAIVGSTVFGTVVSHFVTKKMYKAKVRTVEVENKKIEEESKRVEEENRTLEIKNKGLIVETYGDIIGNLKVQINSYIDDIEEMKVQIKGYRAEVLTEREHSMSRVAEYKQRNKEISDLLTMSNEKIAVLESKVDNLNVKLDREKCLDFKCSKRVPPYNF